MRLSDDDMFEGHTGGGISIVPMAFLVVAFVFVTIGVVFYNNRAPKHSGVTAQPADVTTQAETEVTTETESKTLEELISGSTLVSSDLDFWTMYDYKKDDEKIVTDKNNSDDASDKSSMGESDKETTVSGNSMDKDSKDSQKDKIADAGDEAASDGLHTLIEKEDGSEEWVTINNNLQKNTYDFSGLSYNAPIMSYYKNNTKVSYMGVDVSKYNALVDYNKLKRAGVDFVMIRIGARGYDSGQLVIDDYFDTNIKNATKAGLDVGVYFFSQAITEQEAADEANLVINYLTDYKITYPVAFDMESVDNTTSRIDGLTNVQRTSIAGMFLSSIKSAGYMPVFYGNKEWLINKLNLADLAGYDVWLSQEKSEPDYPYQFTMWQYTNHGSIDGIEGDANLNISFVDYSTR